MLTQMEMWKQWKCGLFLVCLSKWITEDGSEDANASVCRYAELIYNGFWFSPEREALQALIDHTQRFVTGTVRLKLYKVSPRMSSVEKW